MDRTITKHECAEQRSDGFQLRKNILTVVAVWYRNYKTRKALAEMSDRLLDDIGISSYEAGQESRRPFWK